VADQPSEEKTLDASEKKLRDSRKKGKVSQSKDLISAGAFLVVTSYIFAVFPSTRDHVDQLTQMISEALDGNIPGNLWPIISDSIDLSGRVLLIFLAPLVVALVLAVAATGIIGTLGPVFSFELVKPEADHINPAKGLERIFSVRNVVEFAKQVLKVFVLTGAFWLVLQVWIQSFFEIPGCGQHCVVPVLFAALKPLAVTAAIAFLIIGFTDALIQRRLFLRDMRMTKTELKREQKDIEGDPLIRSGRRRIWRQDAGLPAVGLRRATFAIVGADTIVALNADRKKVRVPTIAAMAQGKKSAAMLAEARALGVHIIEDSTLARAVYERHKKGSYLHRDFFDPLIRIMKGLRYW